MEKRILRFAAITVALIFALSLSVFAIDYTDTEGHWGEDAINEWSDNGVVNGHDGKFRPNAPITRAELAKILSYTLRLEEVAENTFPDLPADAWYTRDILKCVAAKIMLGDANGKIRPNDPIKREEAFVMFGRALNITEDENPDLSRFGDGNEVSSWAKGYISSLINLGYVNGVSATKLSPRTNINRASVVTVLSNAIADYVYTDNATVTLSGDGGIVLIVAKNVKILGTAKGPVLVGAGAEGGTVTIGGTAGKVEIDADGVTVKTENAQILTLIFTGEGGMLEKDSGSVITKTEGDFEEPTAPTTPTEPDTPSTPTEPDEPDEPTTPSTPGGSSGGGNGGLVEDDGGLWTPIV